MIGIMINKDYEDYINTYEVIILNISTEDKTKLKILKKIINNDMELNQKQKNNLIENINEYIDEDEYILIDDEEYINTYKWIISNIVNTDSDNMKTLKKIINNDIKLNQKQKNELIHNNNNKISAMTYFDKNKKLLPTNDSDYYHNKKIYFNIYIYIFEKKRYECRSKNIRKISRLYKEIKKSVYK